MIREKIKERLKDLGITQRKLSRELGECEQNVSQFLTGVRGCNYVTFISMLVTLGMSVDDSKLLVGRYPPSDIRYAVSDALRHQSITRKDIADKAGINSCSLSSFLSGKRYINVDSLDKLLQSLDLTLVCYGEPQIED